MSEMGGHKQKSAEACAMSALGPKAEVNVFTQSARPGEMLVVWRKPDGDVREALKGVTFAKGDKVICAEWFDDGWSGGRLRLDMKPTEYEHIHRTIERMANRSRTNRDRELAGFAPFASLTGKRVQETTDVELIHAILGVAD